MKTLLAGLLLLAAASAAAADRPTFDWTRYFDQEAVTAALRTLHDAYPDLTELTSLGRSAEGRDLWQLTISGKPVKDHRTRPAMYVDGAIHGNEIQATEVCLYLAWLLCDRYGEWDRITALVDSTAFYIVPTVNVDSRAHWFDDPTSHDVGRTAREPQDDDHDGLFDEDGPEDLDGDGLILQMRVRDPHGTHRSLPDDPRVTVRARPGEQAEWTLLGLEGVDNDGDGRVNEDGPGYVDMNRGFGFNWQPPYVESGSGPYPLASTNTRAVADFLVAHPNVAFVFAFHNYGGMFLRGPSNAESPPLDPADVAVWDWLGEQGERTVPGYRYLVARDDLYTTYGDFDEFAYQVLGILGYTGEVTMSSEFAFRGRSDETNGDDGTLWSRRPRLDEKQEFNDHLMAGEMFQDWRPFDHPQYGPIEIGGWKPHAVRSTPGWLLPETLHRNAMFVVWTAMQLPRLKLAAPTVENLGAGLWRVRARAENLGAIASLSANHLRHRLGRRDLFTLVGEDCEVVSGGLVADRYLGRVEAADHRPWRLETWLEGGGAREAEWMVRGKGKVTVAYDGLKCGRREATVDLR
ncbi:MAG: M14 family metallopeptidase [Candidatus Krumholzibacteriia bacterium]